MFKTWMLFMCDFDDAKLECHVFIYLNGDDMDHNDHMTQLAY